MVGVLVPPAEGTPAVPSTRQTGERRLIPRLTRVLLALTLVVYARDLSRSAPYYGDSYLHLMNGVFVHDALHEPLKALSDPLRYAVNYYRSYPAVTLGYYLPVFPAIEGVLMSFLGVSPATGQLAVLLLAVLMTWLGFLWFRLRLEPWWAGAATAVMIATPVLVFWGRRVQLEIPVIAFMLGSMLCFERLLRTDRPTWGTALPWAILTMLAFWTKQHSLALAGAFVIAAAAKRRWSHLRSVPVLVSTALVVASALAIVALHLYLGGRAVEETLGFGAKEAPAEDHVLRLLYRWGYYIRVLPLMLGTPAVLAACLGLLAIARGRERDVSPVLGWIVGFYALHSVDLAKDMRYGALWVPPFCALAAIGLRSLRATPPLLRGRSVGSMLMLALVLLTVYGGLTVRVPRVPPAYQHAANVLRESMPPFACLAFLPEGGSHLAMAYRLAVEERRVSPEDIYAFGRIYRAEQALRWRTPPAVEEVAEYFRVWNVKYILRERPSIAFSPHEKLIVELLDGLVEAGKYEEVASYPVQLPEEREFPEVRTYSFPNIVWLKRDVPRRDLVLYQRAGEVVFDTTGRMPPILASRIPRLGAPEVQK
jgi:hypothetical protein